MSLRRSVSRSSELERRGNWNTEEAATSKRLEKRRSWGLEGARTFEKLERRRAGSGDRGKGLGGSNPGDLQVRPPSGPSDGVPLHGQELERPVSDRRSNSAAVDETKQSQKSTESAVAESILRRVKGSSKAYPPLRSVAEDLYIILGNQTV